MALVTMLLELVRDGKRKIEAVLRVLQVIKEDPNFEDRFFGKTEAETAAAEVVPKPKEQPALTTEAQLAEWQAFYREEFGIELDTTQIRIPERKDGFNWLIVVVPTLAMNQIFEACASQFTCWKYRDDLNVISLRKATEPYALWVRERVEADEELKNLSADAIAERRIETADLRERKLLGFVYYRRTGKHLDLENWTLCPLSRDPLGCVSGVHWLPSFREVRVDGWCPGGSCEGVRARQAVL